VVKRGAGSRVGRAVPPSGGQRRPLLYDTRRCAPSEIVNPRKHRDHRPPRGGWPLRSFGSEGQENSCSATPKGPPRVDVSLLLSLRSWWPLALAGVLTIACMSLRPVASASSDYLAVNLHYFGDGGPHGGNVDPWGRNLGAARHSGTGQRTLVSLGPNGRDEQGAGDDIFVDSSFPESVAGLLLENCVAPPLLFSLAFAWLFVCLRSLSHLNRSRRTALSQIGEWGLASAVPVILAIAGVGSLSSEVFTTIESVVPWLALPLRVSLKLLCASVMAGAAAWVVHRAGKSVPEPLDECEPGHSRSSTRGGPVRGGKRSNSTACPGRPD